MDLSVILIPQSLSIIIPEKEVRFSCFCFCREFYKIVI